MVDVKEIQEKLKKLKSNKEILVYLNSLLDKVKDKNLLKEIKFMIEDVKELDAVAQIETKGRVDWSLPEEEEVVEDRSLEKQVAGVPIVREEKEEKEIKYSLGSNVDLYREGTRGPDVKYTGSNVVSEVGGKSFIDGRVNEQYMGKDLDKSHEDIMGEMAGSVKYHALEEESVEYASASVSQEVHERAKKKPLH